MPYKHLDAEKTHRKAYYEKNKDREIERSKAWYEKNKDYKKAREKERCEARRKYINQIKSKPCDMCGGIFPPSAMDFHHIDPETKTNKGGRGIERSWSIEKIDAEIEKCILVCANCHRIIHASVEEVLEFEIWQTTETQRDSSGVRRI